MSVFRPLVRMLHAQGVNTLSRFAVLAAVLLAGIAGSLWSALTLRSEAFALARADHAQAARERVELLRSHLLRSTEILNSITAVFEASAEVTRDEFRRFVTPALTRQPELQALEWIPRVPAAERLRYEQLAAADGLDGFMVTEFSPDGHIVPASPRSEYFPVFYVEPLRGNAPALGLDLAHHPDRRTALDQSRRTGQPVATAPIRLAQSDERQLGFLAFSPVHAADRRFLGFGLAVFRLDRLIEGSLAPLAARGLRVEVRDSAAPDNLLHHVGRAAPNGSPWSHEETLAFASRRWTIHITPGADLPPPTAGWLGWAAPTGILALASLFAGYLLAGFRRTDEIEQKVAEKTLQLSAEVADRQRAEAAAREAEQRYRSIFENAIDGIFQSTADGRYLSANTALARIYGYDTSAELLAACSDIGRQLYVEPSRRDEFIQLVEMQGAVADFVSQVRRRDGSVIWISEKALAVRDAAGALRYYEGIVEDVTDRVRTAAELQRTNEILEERVAERTAQLAQANAALQAEIAVRTRAEATAEAANRAKSLFLADMSHELRTPLNAILGYTQLLQLDPAFSGPPAGALHAIVEGGNHLLCLVDGVLDLTKIEVGRMDLDAVEFDLNVLVRGLAAMFTQRTRQKRLHFTVEAPAASPVWVCGDERKLRQVLINLLSNAVKFTDRGEVRLRVVPTDAPNVFRFEVIDTGPGIRAEAQAAIFEPFHQEDVGRTKGGTGLGLSISRRLVALMGGQLALNSTPGWGSNFFFTLAFNSVSPLLPAPDERTRGPHLAPGTTLEAIVIDDIAANREVLGRMLEHVGCRVRLASDFDEALASIAASPPDAAFIDLRLPGRDGLALVRELRNQFPALRTRFVSYSASAFEHDRERCTAAGFHGFLPKPVRLADLSNCLRTLLDAPLVGPDARPAAPPADASALPPPATLPAEVLARLRGAAEIGDCATLRRILGELSAAGDPATIAWCRPLAVLVDRFDTDAIVSLLAEPALAP